MASTSQVTVTSARYVNCKGVRLRRILSNELTEVTLVSFTLSWCVFKKKVNYEKFHDGADYCRGYI